MASSSGKKPVITMVVLILASCFISTSFSARVVSDPKPNTNPLGFTARLIHRDSPHSPFYNPKLTSTDRLRSAIQRSSDRYNHYTGNTVVPNEMRAPVSYRTFEYVISHRIGTPAVDTYSIIDTGSDLTWLQCRPCDNCYDQEIPIFDPRKSTSYVKVGCEDDFCKEEYGTTCDRDGTSCRYVLDYADAGHSKGILSTETFGFQDDTRTGNIDLLEIKFGCGHNNSFSYLDHETGTKGVPGLIGFSKEPLSFISQLAFDHFSHCLVPSKWNETSLLRFGIDAIITNDTTPMMDHGNITTADYYVKLEGISVGKTRLNIPNGTFDISEEGDGGVIIDTGFGQTHLIRTAYDPLIAEMKKQIELEPTLDPKENVFDFCYQTDTSQTTADTIGMPEITLHLSGLDFVLTRWNIWLDRGHGVVCLTLLPAKDDLTVIGAEHLQNVNVGYDLRKKLISLQNRDCMQT